MSNNVQSTLSFCEEYVETGGDLAALSLVFMGSALALGFVYGIVEIVKKANGTPGPRVSGGGIKELLDALKAFVEALAAAPVWIAFFGVGVVLFWIPGNFIPSDCNAEFNQSYESAHRDKDPAPAPAPNINQQ